MAKINYEVPMVRQLQNPICWVACAAMVLSWRKRQSISVESLIGYDPGSSSIMNPASSWGDMYDLLNGWGIVSIGPQMSPGVDFIVDNLRNEGPFILSHYTRTLAPSVTSVGKHAVVITGIDTDADQCIYSNPWGTENNVVPISTVQASMEKLWLLGLRSVAYSLAET